MKPFIRHALALLASTFREIFDEAAYQRFLERAHAVSSRETYAAFCREYQTAKERKPRCC
jgi:hypothetical protein